LDLGLGLWFRSSVDRSNVKEPADPRRVKLSQTLRQWFSTR
jgi:hypothetical protein